MRWSATKSATAEPRSFRRRTTSSAVAPLSAATIRYDDPNRPRRSRSTARRTCGSSSIARMTGFSTFPPARGALVWRSLVSDLVAGPILRAVDGYELAEAAQRAGDRRRGAGASGRVGDRQPGRDGRFTAGTIRRVSMVRSLVGAGVPLDGLGAAIRSGQLSLDFLDAPAFERFSALSDVTFAQFAERSGVPVDLLMLIREAAGSPAPLPDDLIRDEELPHADLLERSVNAGFSRAGIERLFRVHGDALRRIAETESAFWEAEVGPAGDGGRQAAGRDPRCGVR